LICDGYRLGTKSSLCGPTRRQKARTCGPSSVAGARHERLPANAFRIEEARCLQALSAR
jgi:hypothetical protein